MRIVSLVAASETEAGRIEGETLVRQARLQPASSSPPAAKVVLEPVPPGGTGVPACDEYIRTLDALFSTCQEKLGTALEAMAEGRDAALDAFAGWGKLDEKSRKAAREAAATGCQAATDAVRQAAAAMDCPS